MSQVDWAAFNVDFLTGAGRDALWWQTCIKAILVFLFGLVLIRLLGRRAFGMQTPLDIVLAIIIGSNLSRALTGNAPFLPTLAATALLVVLFWLLDQAAIRWHWLSWLVKGSPVLLMRDGRFERKNMLRYGISEGDLEEAARRSGLRDLGSVQETVFERNGQISTIRRERSRRG